MPKICSFRELNVYQGAMDAAMQVFELTRHSPASEKFALVDQVRRSSRSVCANIAEAWRKRGYKAHFVSKLSDSESEAEETRVWLEFARRCDYITTAQFTDLDGRYDKILAQLVRMISAPGHWTIE